MLTQIISGDIMAAKLDDIIMRTGESNRIIIFRLVDGKGEAITAEDYTMEFILQKPDGNFIIQTLGTITDGFYLHTVEQMAAVKGMGYYTLRISDTDDLIYTAHGAVIIDDNTLSDGDIESISLVNGLRFPDDFFTTDSPVALIDDTDTSTESTWSSSKITDEINEAIGSIDIPPAREYSAVEKVVGKWFNQDLYAITYHDSYTSAGSGAHTTQHDLPGDIKLVEHNYIRYIYSDGIYMLIGNQMMQYLNINIPDEASPTYFNATQTVGNVDQTDIYYTIYYTKEG